MSRYIYATRYAFAALKADGSVVTWGLDSDGGDSSKVKDYLTSGMRSMYSHSAKRQSSEDYNFGFAALKTDRRIIYWGEKKPNRNGSTGNYFLVHQ